jgi:hypothetical protein
MRAFLAGAMMAAGVAGVAAAQRPDFSGQWMRADSAARPSVATAGDAAFRTGDMGIGWGAAVTITQTADSLVVQWVHFAAYDLQPPMRFAYAMNGAESRNDVMIGHATSTQRARVSWRENSLVITTQHPLAAGVGARGGSIEVVQTLTLDAGGALVVETTRAGLAGAAPTTVRVTYNKR